MVKIKWNINTSGVNENSSSAEWSPNDETVTPTPGHHAHDDEKQRSMLNRIFCCGSTIVNYSGEVPHSVSMVNVNVGTNSNHTMDSDGKPFTYMVRADDMYAPNKYIINDSSRHEKKRWWPLFSLFSYATRKDAIQLVIGFIFTLTSSWGVPTLSVIFGQMANVFVHYEARHYHPNQSDDINDLDSTENIPFMQTYCDTRVNIQDFKSDTKYDHDYFLCQVKFLSGGLIVLAALYVGCAIIALLCFDLSAFNQMLTIRKRLFASVLRQDIEWFDGQHAAASIVRLPEEDVLQNKPNNNGKIKSTEFSTRVANDLKQIEAGMNENLCLLIYFVFSTLVNAFYAVYFGWKLALVIFSLVPILALSSGMLTKIQSSMVRRQNKAFGEAGTIAGEIFTAIRTVFAFGGECRALEQYDERLAPANKSMYKQAIWNAISNGLTWATVYCGFAIGVYYGIYLCIHEVSETNEPTYTLGSIIIVFWCAAAVGYNMGYAGPYLEKVQIACTVARTIFATIERQPKIHRCKGFGYLKLSPDYRPEIEFRSVQFAYKTRPNVPVLKGFNLKIAAGETVALVGPSGSGKSTLIQLLLRFYDPNSGAILLNGVDLRSLDIGWLRVQFGVVSQEPILFSGSIRDNIRLGSPQNRISYLTGEEIEAAAKEANAHEFIKALPLGYRTEVGQGGAQLSGGQKQRIAIARALVKNPKILLLDEATSALDLESESIVQAALERASQGRTTIIVAHRLSTIINAHRIVCLDANGGVAEEGSHEQLMARKSTYYELVMRQTTMQEEEDVETETEEEMKSEEIDCKEKFNLNRRRTRSSRCTEPDHQHDDGDTKTDNETPTDGVMLRLVCMFFQSRFSALIGVIASIGFGCCAPMYAYLLGSFVNVFTNHTNMDNSTESASHYVLSSTSPMENIISNSRNLNEYTISNAKDFNVTESMFNSTVTVQTLFPITTMVNETNGKFMFVSTGNTTIDWATILPTQVMTGINNNHTTFGIDNDYLQDQGKLYSMAFLGLACFAFLCLCFQYTFFSIASQRLTTHLRLMVFGAILQQEVSWFERKENAPGVLCSKLSSDPNEIQQATGPRVAMVCQAVATLAISIGFGFYIDWKLSLATVIFMPIMAVSSHSTASILGSQATKEKEKNVLAARIAAETISCIRTVASLHQELFFEKYYSYSLSHNIAMIKRKFYRKSISIALALGSPLIAYAFTFYVGGHLIADHKLKAGNFFKVVESMIFGAIVFGQSCFFSSDYAKAKVAAANLFKLIDSVFNRRRGGGDTNDNDDYEVGYELSKCKGEIEFKDVHFAYPSRPTLKILKGVTFRAPAGKRVALVGFSGCGKSTIVQLLQRFYEPTRGKILLDGIPIQELNLSWMRAQMALISQEPVLFDTTIRDNIAYGDIARASVDNGIPMEEIYEAARKACIDEFIESQPAKYYTRVGMGGCLLSGGQKQRIAIARALIRNPSILLLDEATSALDANSEMKIQATLDSASCGRTTIIIAHRLSTIQNAEKIIYIDRGKVVEEGSHEELMERRDYYWRLYRRQQTVNALCAKQPSSKIKISNRNVQNLDY